MIEQEQTLLQELTIVCQDLFHLGKIMKGQLVQPLHLPLENKCGRSHGDLQEKVSVGHNVWIPEEKHQSSSPQLVNSDSVINTSATERYRNEAVQQQRQSRNKDTSLSPNRSPANVF